MTLSELAIQIRVMAKLLLAVFGGLVLLIFLVVVLIKTLTKPPVEQVFLDTRFGKLEKPVFEKSQKQPNLKFVLDTVNGQLPETTPSAKVYYIPESKSTLAYLTHIRNLAESFGFDTEMIQAEPIGESWVKFDDGVRGLEVNLKNYHFYFYHLSSQTLQQIAEATPEAKFNYLEDHFEEKAREALNSRGSYPVHLASGRNSLVYQRYDVASGKFRTAQPNEVPQAVRIDYFRKDEDLNVVSPLFMESQNYVILAPLHRDAEVIEAKYASFTKFDEDPGVYPLISSEAAWESLNQGQVSTISLSPDNQGKIKIKNIDLAYYDPETYQPYFQPIFVFLGDHNYRGYFPAIDSKYLSQ